MPIVITSRIAGFRRAGVAHPAEPTPHPDGRFTPAQLAQLRAEPMLVVVQTPAEPEPAILQEPGEDAPRSGKKKGKDKPPEGGQPGQGEEQ